MDSDRFAIMYNSVYKGYKIQDFITFIFLIGHSETLFCNQ